MVEVMLALLSLPSWMLQVRLPQFAVGKVIVAR